MFNILEVIIVGTNQMGGVDFFPLILTWLVAISTQFTILEFVLERHLSEALLHPSLLFSI